MVLKASTWLRYRNLIVSVILLAFTDKAVGRALSRALGNVVVSIVVN